MVLHEAVGKRSEYLAIVTRKLRSDDVLRCLTELFVAHGYCSSTFGRTTGLSSLPATCASGSAGSTSTRFIEAGSPWQNGYCESFNSKLRDELLAGEQFSTLHEAQASRSNAGANDYKYGAAAFLARLIAHRRPR